MPSEQMLLAYQRHHINAHNLVRRYLRDGGDLGVMTPIDLAVDPTTEITDQNHLGGLESTLSLGATIDLGSEHRVLDVGCGVGGSARIFALAYGCSVFGVDVAGFRVNDAVELTERVGLSGRVNFMEGDFLAVDIPTKPFDFVVSQDTFNHFEDLALVLARVREHLVKGGQLVVDDVWLRREPLDTDRRDLTALVSIWNARLRDRSSWESAVATAGFEVETITARDASSAGYLRRLIQAAKRTGGNSIPPDEVLGWNLAAGLIESGLLGYARLVATRI